VQSLPPHALEALPSGDSAICSNLVQIAHKLQIRKHQKELLSMNFVKRIFRTMDTAYLIRAYLIAAVFLGIIIVFAFNAASPDKPMPASVLVYTVICALLFPFAKLVWDEIAGLVFGKNVIFMNAILLLVLKVFVNMMLFCFAIFIAPLGILYLWFRSREPAQ
jgi:hypothetical protein